MISAGGNVFAVYDCKKSKTGHFVHIGELTAGTLAVGDSVSAAINVDRRADIMRNHTACHLLQAALRQVLGDHVHQAGAFYDDTICRFDFSHFSAVTPEELKRVEELVNRVVLASIDVSVSEMPIDEAKKLGAMALFGEKYGDVVRVCSVPGESVELCGGTHLKNTAQVGLFRIVKESSVAAGVRRIEAVTGRNVLRLMDEQETTMEKTAAALKVGNLSELPARAEALNAESREQKRRLEAAEAKLAESQLSGVFDNAQQVGGIYIASVAMMGAKIDALRRMGDRVRDSRPDAVCAFSTVNDGKGSILVVCGKDAVAKGAHAGKIVKELTALCGGSGGGRPDNAMGGTSEIFRIDEAMAQLPAIVGKLLK